MNVIILNASQIELVEQSKCVLHMYVVIGDTVHDEEAHILGKGLHVGDGAVFVAACVVLWGVHVAFSVDRVCNFKSAKLAMAVRND